MKQATDYKLYPKNKERLLQEIVKAFDDYDNDELRDDIFINLMNHYQNYFEEEEVLGSYSINENLEKHFHVNPTARKILGKSRSDRLQKMLYREMEMI